MAERRTGGHPLWQLTLARWREFVREPAAVFWTFGFPVLLAVGLGIAFRAKPPDRHAVAVEGGDAEVRATLDLLADAGGIAAAPAHPDSVARDLATGKVDVVVVPGEGPSFTYRYDPLRPESRAARLAVDAALQRALGRTDPARTGDEEVTEPGSRYIDFLIPGLVGLNIMGSSMWGVGYPVVLSRKRRLLKRLAATPMRHSHFLLSYMLSRIVFLLIEVAVLVAFGWIVFGVAVRGSIPGVLIVSFLAGMSFTGIALLVASRTDNTEVAAGIMNAVMLPMWLLSGAFFSYERFPEVVHPVIRLMPLTATNDALRALVNDGAGLLAVWPEIAVLVGWGGIAFLLALRLFRWQ